MTDTLITVTAEMTPNPEAMRFVVNKDIADGGSHEFTSPAATAGAPLAKKLFLFPWVAGVMIGRNFVTVTKKPGMDWSFLQQGVVDFIRGHVASGEPAVQIARPAATAAAHESPLAQRIRAIIDAEIRPAVAQDGGDVVFHSFDDGIVRLYLRGACSGCPSALMTLKMGIERRLQSEIPEVEEVVAIS